MPSEPSPTERNSDPSNGGQSAEAGAYDEFATQTRDLTRFYEERARAADTDAAALAAGAVALATLFVAAIDAVERFRPSTDVIGGYLGALALVVAVSAYARMIRSSSRDVDRAEEALLGLPLSAPSSQLSSAVASVWRALYERAMRTSALKRAAVRVASLFLYAAVVVLVVTAALEL